MLFLAKAASRSVSSRSSPSASPTRRRPVASSSSHSRSSSRLVASLPSSDASSLSDFRSWSDARDTVSSSRVTSVWAVSSEFWKTVRSCLRGASSCVFSSSSLRRRSVTSRVSSKTTSSLASSSALVSWRSRIRSSSAGRLSSASARAASASAAFWASAAALPSSFWTVLRSCLMFSLSWMSWRSYLA